jgi:hypothetical protein
MFDFFFPKRSSKNRVMERIGLLSGVNRVFNTLTGYAINKEKDILFLLAYIFGSISPKSRIMKVTITTSTINFNRGSAIPSKNKGVIEAKSNIMAMFIRLFATRIVANNFLGSDKSFFTRAIRLEGDWSSSVGKSVGDSEKKATSVPEIMAEHNNKTSNTPILVT